MNIFQSLKLVGTALCIASVVAAETFVSPPMGCFPVPLLPGGDNAVGLPLERGAVSVGRIQAIDGPAITVASEPSWGPDCWVGGGPEGEYHFLQVVSGPLRGATFPIVGNGSNTLTLSIDSEDLSVLRSDDTDGTGDALRILPYWTPEAVFAQTEISPGTSLVLFDRENRAYDTGPSVELQYVTGSGWVDSSGSPAGNYPLRNDRGFFVRVPVGSLETCIQLVGFVPVNPERQVFNQARRFEGGEMLFALNHPEAIELTCAGFEFADRTEVFAYDGLCRFDQNPTAIYTYYAGYGWFDQLYRPVSEGKMLEPGSAYFVRIPPLREAASWVWTRQPGYLELL